MNQNSMKKLLSLILCIVLIAAMALFATGCSDKNNTDDPTTGTTQSTEATNPKETTQSTTPTDITIKGEGQTSFHFQVTDLDGTVTKFLIKTDKTIVGDALLDCGLIEGTAGNPGLYITSVNGITADWDTEKAYWAFYINGEYAMTGVDATNIDPDTVYAFVKTVF